jgi:hypothetical protein
MSSRVVETRARGVLSSSYNYKGTNKSSKLLLGI